MYQYPWKCKKYLFCGTGVYTPYALRAETRNHQNRYLHAENRFLNSAEKQKSRSCLLTGKPGFFRIMSVKITLFFDSFGQRSNTLDFAGRKIVCQRGRPKSCYCRGNTLSSFPFPFWITLGDWNLQNRCFDFNRNCRLFHFVSYWVADNF